MITTTAQVEQQFLEDTQDFTSELSRLQRQLGDRPPTRDAAFHDLSQAIRTMTRKCRLMQQRCADANELRLAQQAFQRSIAPWFESSWFMSRAKQKPRGYPGDFELLSGIYDRQPRSSGLGGYLDLYFLHSDLGMAVVARMKTAREFLNREVRMRDGDLNILNVASGPCREFFTGLSMPQAGRRITLHCIDSDLDALRFVEQQVAISGGLALPVLKFVKYNALRMRSAKANTERFGLADIIYSIGLLDYIPDKHLVTTLRGLRQSLKPGGAAYFAFKDANGYDPLEYQWFVDWFFFQRDERQCHELLCAAGFAASEVTVTRDETGIIMNFVAGVGRHHPYRSDTAAQSAIDVGPPHHLHGGNSVTDEIV